MKKFFLCFLTFMGGLCHSLPVDFQSLPQEQQFHLQRIVDFWEEEDKTLALQEAENFLKTYPQSPHCQNLYALLGDYYAQKKAYAKAHQYYKNLSDLPTLEKAIPSHLHALYASDQYSLLVSHVQKLLPMHPWPSSLMPTLNFYLAEGLLRKKAPSQEELKQALVLYEKLEDSPSYQLHALNGLALIYQILENYPQAALYVQKLMEKDLKNHDKHRFTLATLQAMYDKPAALSSYQNILQGSEGFKSEAFYNRALLLFEMDAYPEIIASKKEANQYLGKGKIGTYRYLLGRSYYFQKDYPQAIQALNQAIKTPLEPLELQTAFLTLADCSLQTQDLALCEQVIKGYEKLLPKDAILAKVYFARALILKEKQSPQALKAYGDFLTTFPHFENLDKVLIDLATLHQKHGSYEESRNLLYRLIQDYPQSFYQQQGLRMLIENNLKAYEQDPRPSFFIEDLKFALKYKTALEEEEIKQAWLQLGKLYVDTQAYSQAITTLEDYIQHYPSDTYSFEAHLLLSLCYQQEKQNLHKYIVHAEKILTLRPDWDQNFKVHLNLFNSYLQMLQDLPKASDTQYEALHEKKATSYRQLMAKHLFKALPLGAEVLKKSNLLWLGNYYYQPLANFVESHFQADFSPSQLQSIQKGIKAFELALIQGERLHIQSSKDILEAIKLSQFYGYLSLRSKKKQFLHQLLTYTQNYPGQERLLTLFELGKNAESQGIYQEAKKWYQLLQQEDPQRVSFLKSYARLHLAKIAYLSLPASRKNLNQGEFVSLLNTLKDLSIQRSILFEPLHLEAALAYAEIKSQVSDNPLSTHLELLIKTKKDFLAEDNLLSQDYHQGRKSLKKQGKIFEAYLLYIDAKIQELEAEVAEKNQGNPYEIQVKRQVASKLYQNLFTHKLATTPFLYQKTQEALHFLKEKL